MTALDTFDGRTPAVLRRPGVRQFLKFCIVGASSTAISAGIFAFLVYGVHLDRLLHTWLTAWPAVQQTADQYRLYIQVAALAGFLFAVSNGFFWNNRWTFRQTDVAGAHARYLKFVAVNVIGLILNQVILFIATAALTAGKPSGEKGLAPMIAFMIATGIVVFWNFAANKLWTFKS
jgi:putative flippase GtrA